MKLVLAATGASGMVALQRSLEQTDARRKDAGGETPQRAN